MEEFAIEVRDASSAKVLGYFGGRIATAAQGPLAAYELKIVASAEEAQPVAVESGASFNAMSLQQEFPDKSFQVRKL